MAAHALVHVHPLSLDWLWCGDQMDVRNNRRALSYTEMMNTGKQRIDASPAEGVEGCSELKDACDGADQDTGDDWSHPSISVTAGR